MDIGNERFALILTLISKQVVKEISTRYKITEVDAARDFYKSKVYKMLETERTKFWHFSYMCISAMYDEEKANGVFNIPEEI